MRAAVIAFFVGFSLELFDSFADGSFVAVRGIRGVYSVNYIQVWEIFRR